MDLQVVLPEGMAAESMHSAAGLQILAGEMMVHERTVEQVSPTLYTCLLHVGNQQLLTDDSQCFCCCCAWRCDSVMQFPMGNDLVLLANNYLADTHTALLP